MTHLYAIALLLLTALFPTSPLAADIRLDSKTYLLHYERDLPGENQEFTPVYEYLSADVGGLGGTAVSFHFYGWGRQDLQDETGHDKTSGELGSAYLQYLHPTGNGEARLGRFFLTEGAASEIMDGIFLKARSPVGFGASVFGGVPVEASIISTEHGDSIYGGRIFFAKAGFVELGVSYLIEDGDFQGEDRKEIGGDLWVRPFGPVELLGRVTYNDATGDMAYQRYVLRLTPIARVDLAVGYEEYAYKDYFQRALNPAFSFPAIDNNDEVRNVFAVVDWEVVENVTIILGAKNIKHDSDTVGDATRGELGVKYSYNNRRDAAGFSAAVVSADRGENEYQEYRGYATYSPAKWRFSLDALTHQYDQAIDGTKEAYHVVASAGYQLLKILQLSGDLTYTKSPRFDEDYVGLIRASLSFGAGTGGKQ